MSEENRHNHRFSDWATWFIRLLIPAILLGGWQAYTELQQLSTQVAVIAQKIDDHSRALDAIWKRLHEPTP